MSNRFLSPLRVWECTRAFFGCLEGCLYLKLEDYYLTYDRVFIGRSDAFVPLVHSHLERQQSRFYCIVADKLRFGQDSQARFHDAYQSLRRCSVAARLPWLRFVAKRGAGNQRSTFPGLCTERECARRGFVRSAGKRGS